MRRLLFVWKLLTTDEGQFRISVVRSCRSSPYVWLGNCYFPLIPMSPRGTAANFRSANPATQEPCLQKSHSCPNAIPKWH